MQQTKTMEDIELGLMSRDKESGWKLCAELAAETGKTEATIRNWVATGKVERKKVFRTTFYRMSGKAAV